MSQSPSPHLDHLFQNFLSYPNLLRGGNSQQLQQNPNHESANSSSTTNTPPSDTQNTPLSNNQSQNGKVSQSSNHQRKHYNHLAVPSYQHANHLFLNPDTERVRIMYLNRAAMAEQRQIQQQQQEQEEPLLGNSTTLSSRTTTTNTSAIDNLTQLRNQLNRISASTTTTTTARSNQSSDNANDSSSSSSSSSGEDSRNTSESDESDSLEQVLRESEYPSTTQSREQHTASGSGFTILESLEQQLARRAASILSRGAAAGLDSDDIRRQAEMIDVFLRRGIRGRASLSSPTTRTTTANTTTQTSSPKYRTALTRSEHPLNQNQPYMSYFEVTCVETCHNVAVGIMRGNRVPSQSLSEPTGRHDDTSNTEARITRIVVPPGITIGNTASSSDDEDMMEHEDEQRNRQDDSTSSSDGEEEMEDENEDQLEEADPQTYFAFPPRDSGEIGTSDDDDEAEHLWMRATVVPSGLRASRLAAAPSSMETWDRQQNRFVNGSTSENSPPDFDTYHMDYMSCAPGFTNHSCGWLSNGYFYNGTRLSQSGVNYSLQQLLMRKQTHPTLLTRRGNALSDSWGKKGDVIGMGIIWNEGRLFFTKNGIAIGERTFDDEQLEKNCARDRYYAVCALHQHGEAVEFNFGQKPFAYNLTKRLSEERSRYQEKILKNCEKQPLREEVLKHSGELNAPDVSAQATERNLVHRIIQRYLFEMGYADALKSFEKSLHLRSLPQDKCLLLRKQIREFVELGQIDEALDVLSREESQTGILRMIWERKKKDHSSSHLMRAYRTTMLYLHAQKVIELFRRDDALSAAMYMRQHLGEYISNVTLPYPSDYFTSSGWPARNDMSRCRPLPSNHPSSLIDDHHRGYVLHLCGLLAVPNGYINTQLHQTDASVLPDSYFRQEHRDRVACMVCSLLLLVSAVEQKRSGKSSANQEEDSKVYSASFDPCISLDRLFHQKNLVMSLLGYTSL